METKTKQPTTGNKEAFDAWQAFEKAASLGDELLASETHYVRNPGVNEIFREYFSNYANRKYLSIKVYSKTGGDTENKMVFTARTTGAKFTVYERR